MTNPRTGMEPEFHDAPPSPMPRDPRTIDLFDGHPENAPDEPAEPRESIPTSDEGREAGGAS